MGKTVVNALKDFYIAQGGEAADIKNVKNTDEALKKIFLLLGGSATVAKASKSLPQLIDAISTVAPIPESDDAESDTDADPETDNTDGK